jgi:hypothetical protein
MSVILDALRKLDRERASRQSGKANIAVEILTPDLPRRGKRILFYFAAVSLATAVITYAVMVELGFLSKPSPPAPVNPPSPSQLVSPAPLPREQVPSGQDQVSRVRPKIQTPVKSQPSAESKASAKGETPAESRIPATSLDEEEEEEMEVDVPRRKIKKTAEPIPKKSATTPQSLRVSGIVWHEEPPRRLAVINGMIMTEGSVIEGVKIEEIYPTGIRLSQEGRLFELSLSGILQEVQTK